MSSPFPTAYQIEEMTADREVASVFNNYLADPIDIIVVGQDLHIGGDYTLMQTFHDGVLARVAAALKLDDTRVEVVRVIGGGKPYHVEFVELVPFNSQGKTAQMEFLESGYFHAHAEEHESKSKEEK